MIHVRTGGGHARGVEQAGALMEADRDDDATESYLRSFGVEVEG